MNTLNDLREYARTKGMSEASIERLISEVETDENGNVPDYDNIVLGINCEMVDKFSIHDFGVNRLSITFKAKYIVNTTKELDGKIFSGTEMKIKRLTYFVKKGISTKKLLDIMTDVALLYEDNEERLIGVEIVDENFI